MRSEIFTIIPTKIKANKDMQDAVIDKIRKKIARARFGEVFFVSSFPKYDVEYVTKKL